MEEIIDGKDKNYDKRGGKANRIKEKTEKLIDMIWFMHEGDKDNDISGLKFINEKQREKVLSHSSSKIYIRRNKNRTPLAFTNNLVSANST